jgi:hypothetical protein
VAGVAILPPKAVYFPHILNHNINMQHDSICPFLLRLHHPSALNCMSDTSVSYRQPPHHATNNCIISVHIPVLKIKEKLQRWHFQISDTTFNMSLRTTVLSSCCGLMGCNPEDGGSMMS